MTWLIFFGAIAGIIIIFYQRFKDTKRLERLKVKVERREPQALHSGKGIPFNEWKRKDYDYKAINEAFNKADVYFAKGDFDEANRGFVQVLALNPDHAEANNKLGLIYMHKNMPAKAEAIFRKLIETNQKNPIFYSNLGLALYTQGHLDEAKEAYMAATMIEPKKESRFLSLGQVCSDLRHYRDAINAYSKALEFNPKNTDLFFVICDFLIKLRAYEEALAFMKTLLEMQPYNATAKERSREIKMLMGTNPLTHSKMVYHKQEKMKSDSDQPTLFKNP